MKLFIAYIDIICGEYGFGNRYLIVAKNLKGSEKIAQEYVKKENAMYPGETYYELEGVSELNYIDRYKVKYKLRKL